GSDTRRLVEQNAQLARVSGFPTVDKFIETYYKRLTDAWLEHEYIPAPAIREALLTAAGQLYYSEGLDRPLAKPNFPDDIAEARYRDHLLAIIRKQANPETLRLINRTLLDAELEFTEFLPQMAHGTIYGEDAEGDEPEPSFTVPLIDVLQNP